MTIINPADIDHRPDITIDLNPGGNGAQAEAKARQIYPELAGHPDLFNNIRDFSRRVGLQQIPKVTISPTPLMANNAGARTNNDGTTEIEISPSFLAKQNSTEMAGVMGHEIAHIVLGHTTPRTPDTLGRIVDRIFKSDYALPFSQIPIQAALWASRRREKAADIEGAKIAGSADGLISSLKKTKNEHEPWSSKFLERLEERLNERLGNHPPDGKRAKTLQKLKAKQGDKIAGPYQPPKKARGKASAGLMERVTIASMSLAGRSSTHAAPAKAPRGMKVPAKLPAAGAALKNALNKLNSSAPVTAMKGMAAKVTRPSMRLK